MELIFFVFVSNNSNKVTPEAATRDVLSKKIFFKILQYSQENTCVGSLLIKLQAFRPVTLLKRDSNADDFL